jgi:hypothetical protein
VAPTAIDRGGLKHILSILPSLYSKSSSSNKALDQLGLGNTMLQRLRSYAKMTSFQQEVMRVAVTQLDGAHLAGIKVRSNDS